MSEQDDNLDRVSARIGAAIYDFFGWRTQVDQLEFHAEDMRHWVTRTVGMVAPGSPDRVMRAMREAGVINYRVLDRAQSLYQIELGSRRPPLQFDEDGQSYFV